MKKRRMEKEEENEKEEEDMEMYMYKKKLNMEGERIKSEGWEKGGEEEKTGEEDEYN